MIPWLAAGSDAPFPPVESALATPNGLLCAGADLGVSRLLAGYRSAIFPWFNEGEPPLWWSPDPRMVLEPASLHIARRLERTARRLPWHFSVNQRFADVLKGCAAPRADDHGTWLHAWMIEAYVELHRHGFAHSIEIYLPADLSAERPGPSGYCDDQPMRLVGGTYGVAMGAVFFAESMFSAARDASKIALLALTRLLARSHCALIDCQLNTPHLRALGATEIPRSQLIQAIAPDTPRAPLLKPQPLSPLGLLLHSAA